MPQSKPPQILRRDFLVGTAAGFSATAGFVEVRSEVFRNDRCDRIPDDVTLSYAQCGEDVIVAAILAELHPAKGTYLDVGAFQPIISNNTYLLYQRGYRGVLVEPNVDLIPMLRSNRPGDTVLNVGVGLSEESAADYYCMSNWQWNTFNRDHAERCVRETGGKVKIERVVQMPLIPINRIMTEHFTGEGPDFLSIDIESLDLAVLRTMDFSRFRPKVISTETLLGGSILMDPETTKFLASRGYEVRGITWANTIFIDQSLPKSRKWR